MKFNDHLKRGFFNFADGSKGYNSYLAYCCTVGQVAISVLASNSGGIVLVSTMPLGALPQVFLNQLGLFAREHGALDSSKIDQFSIIEFDAIEAAERFAFVLVDWLKDCECLEDSSSERDEIRSVQSQENYSARTEH